MLGTGRGAFTALGRRPGHSPPRLPLILRRLLKGVVAQWDSSRLYVALCREARTGKPCSSSLPPDTGRQTTVLACLPFVTLRAYTCPSPSYLLGGLGLLRLDTSSLVTSKIDVMPASQTKGGILAKLGKLGLNEGRFPKQSEIWGAELLGSTSAPLSIYMKRAGRDGLVRNGMAYAGSLGGELAGHLCHL